MPVVRGFREYILSNPWDSSNIPREAEHGMTQLEVGNPSVGGGTSQAFRMTVLEWTPDRGIFEMWVGQEIIALRKLASAAATNANTSEILASARLIEETAQHIMDTLSQQNV